MVHELRVPPGGDLAALRSVWPVLCGYLLCFIFIGLYQGPQSKLRALIGRDVKDKLSALPYTLAIGLAYVNVFLSKAIYVCVATMWLIPDRRNESKLDE